MQTRSIDEIKRKVDAFINNLLYWDRESSRLNGRRGKFQGYDLATQEQKALRLFYFDFRYFLSNFDGEESEIYINKLYIYLDTLLTEYDAIQSKITATNAQPLNRHETTKSRKTPKAIDIPEDTFQLVNLNKKASFIYKKFYAYAALLKSEQFTCHSTLLQNQMTTLLNMLIKPQGTYLFQLGEQVKSYLQILGPLSDLFMNLLKGKIDHNTRRKMNKILSEEFINIICSELSETQQKKFNKWLAAVSIKINNSIDETKDHPFPDMYQLAQALPEISPTILLKAWLFSITEMITSLGMQKLKEKENLARTQVVSAFATAGVCVAIGTPITFAPAVIIASMNMFHDDEMNEHDRSKWAMFFTIATTLFNTMLAGPSVGMGSLLILMGSQLLTDHVCELQKEIECNEEDRLTIYNTINTILNYIWWNVYQLYETIYYNNVNVQLKPSQSFFNRDRQISHSDNNQEEIKNNFKP